jgi:hypothetical protein
MLNVDLPESTDRGVTLRKTLSLLEVIQDQVKQRTIRPRQYAVLESLYRGMMGWRVGLICKLLQRFCDAPKLAQQQGDEDYLRFLREIGAPTEPPGEPEHQELLRLLEEEIASLREEFAYAEKANEERAAIERDACLAPEGETWSMMLRQEAALDRSIDRKVRILLRLRKESANLPIAPAGQDDGGRMENIEEALESDIQSDNSQSGEFTNLSVAPPGQDDGTRTENTAKVLATDISSEGSQSRETAKNLKLKEQCANVIENKGSGLDSRRRSGNIVENKCSYAQNAGMLLKTKGVIGKTELRATSKLA